MNWFRELGRRFLTFIHRSQFDSDLQEEMRLHRELREQEQIERGLSSEEAHYAAQRRFGNELLLREQSREMWGWNWLENFFQDVRYGLRMLVKNPGFTAAAVVTLALGIGANAAIFSVVDAVLLRPLPFREPQRLVSIVSANTKKGTFGGSVSYPDFEDWRAQSRELEGMAVYRTTMFTLTGRGQAQYVMGAVVSSNLFSLLGVTPAVGRSFLSQEDQPGGGNGTLPVVIGHDFWVRQFNSNPRALAQTLALNGRGYTVAGIMPEGFQFPIQAEPVELWATIAVDAQPKGNYPPNTQLRGDRYLGAIGRLAQGVSLERAQTGMNTIAARLAKEYPANNTNVGVKLIPEQEHRVGDVRPALLMLFGAVGLILLIACVNVTNLLLAKSTVRQREIALRLALGAGRTRVVRQLLTENTLLTLLGGTVGLLLTPPTTQALAGLNPEETLRAIPPDLGGRVVMFTLCVSLLVGVAVGLAAASRAWKAELAESLKEARPTSVGGRGLKRSLAFLVISEIALTLILLVGAGLMIGSLQNLVRVDPGFSPDHVIAATLALPEQKYDEPKQVRFFQELIARVETLPGVRMASAVAPLPLTGSNWSMGFQTELHPFPEGQMPYVGFHIVAPGYFRTMGIPLLSGREFSTTDDLKAPLVVAVSQSFARTYFPGQDPIGQRIQPMRLIGEGPPPMREIVAIAGDVRSTELRTGPAPEVYLPMGQAPMSFMTVVARIQADPRSITGALRRQVRDLDADQPIYELETMNEYFSLSVGPLRFYTLLLGIFAGLALSLAAVGTYGVMSYSVAHRTHEIGIRAALGAGQADILRLIVNYALKLTLSGVTIGIGGALGLTRVLCRWLYGVGPTDALTFVFVAVILIAVALVASYIPARRAAKVDPMVALRYE
jgi:putative ABC transport system permease protein